MYLKEFKRIFKNKKNIIYFLVLFFVIFWTFKIIPSSHILGLTKFFNILPYGSAEFEYIGLVFIIISNIFLLKKILEPSVCKV